MEQQYAYLDFGTPEQLARAVARDTEKYAAVIKRAGIKPE